MEPLPVVIHQQQGTIFKFWLDGRLNDGLRLQNTLYRRVHRFPISHRDQAYALGCALAQQKIRTVLTRSPNDYSVWIDLRNSGSIEELNDKLTESEDELEEVEDKSSQLWHSVVISQPFEEIFA
jgi:hypothetical protein